MTHYVLVPGGFIDGRYWDGVAQRLEKAGHHVDVVDQLPSAGFDPSALGDLTTDAAAVRRRVEDAGEPVVLVGHSYGGMVITELADHPDIAHSVYLAAAWPARGQSMFDLFGGGPPPAWIAAQPDGTLRATDDLQLLRDGLCADVEREQAEAELQRMLPQSLTSASTPSSAPARAHPTTYIVCEQDMTLRPAAQEQMAAAADRVERLPSSHQPMLSMPDELAAILARVS
ncbi:alpha/beta hydrolase [Actinomycetospora endophytica]|uniref:Alpha/beta hydrolase n=1 Tax=Actinomycetospora endophytica TaxID=2291215 RepID=A0ABS8PJF9_9PSEU|nr:alpha/beta hydrolase [Actinomycetospora endophytica]MCD2198067.1 alpha/beta hydrolase [Actinomycetospora endophytica]